MKSPVGELCYDMNCPFPIAIQNPAPRGVGFSNMMHVGCKDCGACRHNKRTEWSFRISQEAKHSDTVYFLTLTYHDSVLPYTDLWLPTLETNEITKFLKRLRKEQDLLGGKPFRYFLVGEYGSRFQRPHYHLILFNLLPKLSDPGYLTTEWNHGIVHRLILDNGLTHYATKYHVTSQKSYRHLSDNDDRLDEFTRSSRMPPPGEQYGGIGYQYIHTHGDWHRQTKNTYVINNGFKQKMPKYYYDIIFNEFSEIEKAELRERAFERFQKAENDEHLRLLSQGFEWPEYELLQRNYYAAKNVINKAKKKGLF